MSSIVKGNKKIYLFSVDTDYLNLFFAYAKNIGSIIELESNDEVAAALERLRMAVTNVGPSKEEVQNADKALLDLISTYLSEEQFETFKERIITQVKLVNGSNRATSRNDFVSVNAVDEVVPGLFISSKIPVRNDLILSQKGITHICSCIKVSLYYPKKFKYFIIQADDTSTYNMKRYFELTFRFIDSAISHGGACLVHCRAGVSRAPTIAIAYLMRKLKIPETIALAICKRARPCARPNIGFISQLKDYEEDVMAGRFDQPVNTTGAKENEQGYEESMASSFSSDPILAPKDSKGTQLLASVTIPKDSEAEEVSGSAHKESSSEGSKIASIPLATSDTHTSPPCHY